MLQTLKVFALRRFFRLISPMPWRHAVDRDVPCDNLQLPPQAGARPARLYHAESGAQRPLLVYFHGGGWVVGDLDTHDPFCRALCRDSGCHVLAVDYRLAPEHPFPAAQDDALAVARWAAGTPELPASGNGRLLLAGDSAGGNLACSVSLELEGAARDALSGVIAFYPVVDHYRSMPPSYVEKARAKPLGSKLMVWFWDTYLAGRDPASAEAGRAMPLNAASLAGMPPTFLVTAEEDPLRDEGITFAERLREAEVPLCYRHYGDAAHGFACSEGPTPDQQAVMASLRQWLSKLPR